jgi:hypothetical protein
MRPKTDFMQESMAAAAYWARDLQRNDALRQSGTDEYHQAAQVSDNVLGHRPGLTSEDLKRFQGALQEEILNALNGVEWSPWEYLYVGNEYMPDKVLAAGLAGAQIRNRISNFTPKTGLFLFPQAVIAQRIDAQDIQNNTRQYGPVFIGEGRGRLAQQFRNAFGVSDLTTVQYNYAPRELSDTLWTYVMSGNYDFFD